MMHKHHIMEQDWTIMMKRKKEIHEKVKGEIISKLQILEQHVLMGENNKDTMIQGLLDSHELSLKDTNDSYEKQVWK
jgi:hypothetical protein